MMPYQLDNEIIESIQKGIDFNIFSLSTNLQLRDTPYLPYSEHRTS